MLEGVGLRSRFGWSRPRLAKGAGFVRAQDGSCAGRGVQGFRHSAQGSQYVAQETTPVLTARPAMGLAVTPLTPAITRVRMAAPVAGARVVAGLS